MSSSDAPQGDPEAAVFTKRFEPATNPPDGPFSDLTVSIKDLLDVEGYPTRAGSRSRHDARPRQCGTPPPSPDCGPRAPGSSATPR